MISYLPLSAVEVTNQCVVVCDLRKWTGPESPAWQVLRGYQDEVGQNLAALLDISGVRRFDDFGGVCERRHRRPQVQAARFATSSISRDIWRPGRWRGRRSRGSLFLSVPVMASLRIIWKAWRLSAGSEISRAQSGSAGSNLEAQTDSEATQQPR
jgi:hypothetical protein